MTDQNDVMEKLINKLGDVDIGETAELFDLIEECRKVLVKTQCNVKKIDGLVIELKELFKNADLE